MTVSRKVVVDGDITIIHRDRDGGAAALVDGGRDLNRAVCAAAAQGDVSGRHQSRIRRAGRNGQIIRISFRITNGEGDGAGGGVFIGGLIGNRR